MRPIKGGSFALYNLPSHYFIPLNSLSSLFLTMKSASFLGLVPFISMALSLPVSRNTESILLVKPSHYQSEVVFKPVETKHTQVVFVGEPSTGQGLRHGSYPDYTSNSIVDSTIQHLALPKVDQTSSSIQDDTPSEFVKRAPCGSSCKSSKSTGVVSSIKVVTGGSGGGRYGSRFYSKDAVANMTDKEKGRFLRGGFSNS